MITWLFLRMGEGEKPAVKPDQTKCSCKSSALDSEDMVSKAMVINLVQITVPFMNIIKATPYAPEQNSHRTTRDEGNVLCPLST